MGLGRTIRIRGARQNNLRRVDLDIPHRQWLAIVGPSGSGKSSLAVQTLYAEGQRRYVESFSPYTRQYLDQAAKPVADWMEAVPAAVLVAAAPQRFGRRTTIGSITECEDCLRQLFAEIGEIRCPECQCPVTAESAGSLGGKLEKLKPGSRFMIGFSVFDWWSAGTDPDPGSFESMFLSLRELGFARIVCAGKTVEPGGLPSSPAGWEQSAAGAAVIVDRLVAGRSPSARVLESLESALQAGNGKCWIWLDPRDARELAWNAPADSTPVDGIDWCCLRFSRNLDCGGCGRRFRPPDSESLNSASPAGACPDCGGLGEKAEYSRDRIVPDDSLTIRGGAIAPWNSPPGKRELDLLLAACGSAGLDPDRPFRSLGERDVSLLWKGIEGTEFRGLDAFFALLEKQKNRKQNRGFPARWKVWQNCGSCRGMQLNPEALACRIAGENSAELQRRPVASLLGFLKGLTIPEPQARRVNPVLAKLLPRLEFLVEAGLGQLPLHRRMAALSSGQAQRVLLTCALASSLVHMLYVLDEPAGGLHPENVRQILPAIGRLHRRPNTLVVVGHSRELLEAAERIVELGPEAGEAGGEVVFDGTLQEITDWNKSPTGLHLAGLKGGSFSGERRKAAGVLKVAGARGRNLRSLDAGFPLGCLTLVTGVSGAGKSTLIRDTLLPLVNRELGNDSPPPLACDGLQGLGAIEDVVWIDSTPLQRTGRSIPATCIRVYDGIRSLFAATADAKSGNLTAGSFSFNRPGGRCPRCEGAGKLAIDMQFLADVAVVCEDCQGRRFQSAPLQVRYRGLNIDEVLQLTGNQAFVFFRGQPKIQKGLKALKDAGLGYLRLGQSLATLSRGETQRLKLALRLAARSRRRTLFLLDSPTAGLHMDDVTRMVDGFATLLEIGHTLVVIEHSLQMISHADWVLDLGPGSDQEGGQLVFAGTPEELAACPDSLTGKHLAGYFGKFATGPAGKGPGK